MTQFSRCLTSKIAQQRAEDRAGLKGGCLVWPLNALHDTWRLCFGTPHKALKCHFRRLKWRRATPTAQVGNAGRRAGKRRGQYIHTACLTLQSCSSALPLSFSLSLCPQANKAVNSIDDGDKLECLRLAQPLPQPLPLPLPLLLLCTDCSQGHAGWAWHKQQQQQQHQHRKHFTRRAHP